MMHTYQSSDTKGWDGRLPWLRLQLMALLKDDAGASAELSVWGSCALGEFRDAINATCTLLSKFCLPLI